MCRRASLARVHGWDTVPVGARVVAIARGQLLVVLGIGATPESIGNSIAWCIKRDACGARLRRSFNDAHETVIWPTKTRWPMPRG